MERCVHRKRPAADPCRAADRAGPEHRVPLPERLQESGEEQRSSRLISQIGASLNRIGKMPLMVFIPSAAFLFYMIRVCGVLRAAPNTFSPEEL